MDDELPGPFYTRAWFLGLVLAAFVGVTSYTALQLQVQKTWHRVITVHHAMLAEPASLIDIHGASLENPSCLAAHCLATTRAG